MELLGSSGAVTLLRRRPPFRSSCHRKWRWEPSHLCTICEVRSYISIMCKYILEILMGRALSGLQTSCQTTTHYPVSLSHSHLFRASRWTHNAHNLIDLNWLSVWISIRFRIHRMIKLPMLWDNSSNCGRI